MGEQADPSDLKFGVPKGACEFESHLSYDWNQKNRILLIKQLDKGWNTDKIIILENGIILSNCYGESSCNRNLIYGEVETIYEIPKLEIEIGYYIEKCLSRYFLYLRIVKISLTCKISNMVLK